MRYAVIENDLVTNVALADDAEFAADQGWVACPDGCEAGWSYVDDVFAAPAPPIDEAKATLWNAAKSHREQRENGGVSIPGVGTVQSDAISRGYINGAVLMAQIALTQSQPYAINWTLADNSVVTLDALGMIAVGVAAGQHVAACHAAAQAIRASIDAAEDHAALAVIDVEAGYP